MKTMKILALGPEGTYGHEAAVIASKRLQGVASGSVKIEFCSMNVEILLGVAREKVFGVVPVENATAGLVSEVIKDYWLRQKKSPTLSVVGEILIPVNHSLLVRPDIKRTEEVKGVMSHPQALAQCAGNLNKLGLVSRIPTKSTAGAAKEVASDPAAKEMSAIASAFAGQLYGLKALKEHLEDFPGNVTRFHLVAGKGMVSCLPTEKDKTAIIFWLPNRPRALVDALSGIGDAVVNMSSIHSIPMGIAGKYAFYCEFDCHAKSSEGKLIMRKLRAETEKLLVLGSFPRETE